LENCEDHKIFFDPVVFSIPAVYTIQSHPQQNISSLLESLPSQQTELDSNADSPVVGKNAYILKYMNKEVSLSGFTDKLGNIAKVPIVQAAVVHDCKYTGNSYIFHINNALFIINMSSNLIPPFLLRLNGIDVNECPKHMACHPEEFHHSIYFCEKKPPHTSPHPKGN